MNREWAQPKSELRQNYDSGNYLGSVGVDPCFWAWYKRFDEFRFRSYSKLNATSTLAEILKIYETEISPNVPGWFYPPDIAAFVVLLSAQTQNEISADICEVGVFEAKSAILLSALRAENEYLHLYDFYGHPDQIEMTARNLGQFASKEKVKLTGGDTRKLDAETLSFTLRFLHIDGGHDHSNVLNDLQKFVPHLTDTGIIALDDCNNPDFPGVGSAMAEFCLSSAGQLWRPFAAPKVKMFLSRRQYCRHYQSVLLNAQVFESFSVNEVLDLPVLLIQSGMPESIEEVYRALDPGGIGIG